MLKEILKKHYKEHIEPPCFGGRRPRFFFTGELKKVRKHGKEIVVYPSKRDLEVIEKVHMFLDEYISKHISIDATTKTAILYRDETMTDEYISKLQDTLYNEGWNVEIVYSHTN